METTKNLQKVSFVFFAIIGFLHIVSGLMVANNYFTNTFHLINETLDIPFAISSIVYGFSSLKLSLTRYYNLPKAVDLVLISLSIILLIGLFYLNFAFPDLPSNS